jgi:hypothetical protein
LAQLEQGCAGRTGEGATVAPHSLVGRFRGSHGVLCRLKHNGRTWTKKFAGPAGVPLSQACRCKGSPGRARILGLMSSCPLSALSALHDVQIQRAEKRNSVVAFAADAWRPGGWSAQNMHLRNEESTARLNAIGYVMILTKLAPGCGRMRPCVVKTVEPSNRGPGRWRPFRLRNGSTPEWRAAGFRQSQAPKRDNATLFSMVCF